MADDKDNPGFLRKVARFVANPTTDWADLNTNGEENRESEFAKSEIKAMIERKRRNDFVRKREFDMLRKIRREGLAGSVDNGIGMSNLDSEPRAPDGVGRSDAEVKAKIDAIEQQMVGESLRRHAAQQEHNSAFFNAPTQPATLPGGVPSLDADTISAEVVAAARSAGHSTAAVVVGTGLNKAPVVGAITGIGDIDVSEVVHDPELDEAVIAFANADFDQCERSLAALVAPGGRRADHSETWLVLFDLYRATDQHQKFETLAVEYAQLFGQSAPQWFSLPQQVAEATAAAQKKSGASHASAPSDAVGWVAPEILEAETVAALRSQLIQMPYPWVLDWTPLAAIDPHGAHDLAQLLRAWSREPHSMRWLGAQHLLDLIVETAPVGARDMDPAFWLLRLEVLRMVNRSDQFDEVAIDYCVTYEVSPPSWESASCKIEVHETETGITTRAPLSKISEVATSFVESRLEDEPSVLQVASLELSGQMVGDVSGTLSALEAELGAAVIVSLSCSRLIRVDFIAAGDLLNWVLSRRGENRTIHFEDANRLVALFFGAMGINEHARVRIRQV
ncbi:MAG: hypothetical protein EPO01_21685 [Aquabacterium sp.]|jgi:hypothetical protein|nr:MAG: hypothetical protein EPO12_03200 [Aquabacterium sp.]TAL13347.1 MAG: hypothetical protein EPO01_21685 [Aquabacterium sp.]